MPNYVVNSMNPVVKVDQVVCSSAAFVALLFWNSNYSLDFLPQKSAYFAGKTDGISYIVKGESF